MRKLEICRLSCFLPLFRLSDVVPTGPAPQQRHFSSAAASRLQQHLNDLSVRSGASGGDRSHTRHLANTTSNLPSDDLSVISELKTPDASSGELSLPSTFTGRKIKEFR